MRISIPYCVDFQLLIALQTPFTFCHYAISHDEDTFPDSFTFKPERWLRDGRERPNPFGSIPFGFGVRGCVGRRIAELEMYLLLFQVSDKKEKKLLNIPGKLLDFFKCDSGVSNNKCGGLGGEGSHGKWEKIWRKSGTASLMLKGIYVSYASLLFVIVWDNTFVHIQINCHPRFRQLTNSIFFSQLIRQFEIKPDPTLGELRSISRTVLIPDKQLNLHFVDRR